jgi:hypothetical protein
MRLLASLAIVSGAIGWSGCADEGNGEPAGRGASPTVSQPSANVSGGVGSPSAEPAQEPTQSYLEPSGVVLDDGRVVSEDEARTGLAPKSDVFIRRRLYGSTAYNSISTLSITDAPTNTHVCGLSLVWGVLTQASQYGIDNLAFERGSSLAYLMNNGSNWTLLTYPDFQGVGTTQQMTIEAACYPLSAFSAQDGGGILLSSAFDVSMPGTGSSSINTWWGDAATFLTAVGGPFAGTGELARVSQNATTNAPSKLTLKSLQNYEHIAEAHSLFVGQSGGGHLALFVGPNGVGSSQAAGEWTYDYEGSSLYHDVATPMAKTSEAFCYLTKITGNWGDSNQSGAPWVQIGLDSTHTYWTLKAWAPGNFSAQAYAACYRLQQ